MFLSSSPIVLDLCVRQKKQLSSDSNNVNIFKTYLNLIILITNNFNKNEKIGLCSGLNFFFPVYMPMWSGPGCNIGNTVLHSRQYGYTRFDIIPNTTSQVSYILERCFSIK